MTWLGFSRFHAPVVICEKVVPIAIQASAFCTISFALFHPKEPTTPAKRGWSSDMTPRPPQDVETIGIPRASAKRSEEHTSELQSLMRTSYAVFCLKKKKKL